MQDVGKHEAALGIGIDDFDRLPRHRGHDIAGSLRPAAGHVLHYSDRADGVDLCLARSERVHETDDTGRSRHISFHVLHPGSGLDRNAAGIEAYSLTDECDRGNAALATVPAHDHGAALVLRALTDPEQRIHAELLHLRGIEDFDGNTEFF